MPPSSAKEQLSSSPSLCETRAPYFIALIEDNPADAFLAQEAIGFHNIPADVLVIRDGEEAIHLITEADRNSAAPCPQLFLLDLNIPIKSGEEVLAHIRNSKNCAKTPVVVVTSSDSAQDRARARELGANRYFRKPSDYDAYMLLGEVIKEMLEA